MHFFELDFLALSESETNFSYLTEPFKILFDLIKKKKSNIMMTNFSDGELFTRKKEVQKSLRKITKQKCVSHRCK